MTNPDTNPQDSPLTGNVTEQTAEPPPEHEPDNELAAEPAAGAWAVTQLAISPRLRQRRFELLPLRGPGSPFTDLQGRQPGDATAPTDLVDLISSISTVGVLEPVLVEEITQPDGTPPAMKLTAGERRLRAVRWGAVHKPDNPHFTVLPAVVVPGPLTEEERRIWQLVENLARTDLRPSELAAALLLQRCAVLVGKLLAAGITVPVDVYQLDDPVARFRALERLRGTNTRCAAPWAEVLTRLGLQLSPRKARQLVRAFAELPRELSEQMDQAKIELHTRIRFAELRRGRAAAADGIWAAVTHRGEPHLLAAAVTAASAASAAGATGDTGATADTDVEVDPEEAVTTAHHVHEQANAARAAKLRRPTGTETTTDSAVPSSAPSAAPGAHPASATSGALAPTAERTTVRADVDANVDVDVADVDVAGVVEPHLVTDALNALRALATAAAHGERLRRHDQHSLQLLVDQIAAAPAAA